MATPAVPEAIFNPEIKYTKLFINNKWVDSKDGSTFETINPSTEEKIATVSEAKEADINDAVDAAKQAFKSGSPWREMDASQRGRLLNKVADLIERDARYISSLESANGGGLYRNNLTASITEVLIIFRYFAGWADKYHGKTIPFDGNYFCYTKHEPVGVCGAIIPWNFPIVLFACKVAPCLAMGNVIVVKPAEQTPLTALYMASLFMEAGFPPGVINVVPGFGPVAGRALSLHMEVDKITFTGSGATGRLIQKASADSNLKRVSLELGGKSPNIIFPDVDLDYAVQTAHAAIFTNSGQICSSGSRTYVHEDIYDEFVKRSVVLAKERIAGDARKLTTNHGPVVSKLQQDRVMELINSGIKAGCTVMCGGNAIKDRKGFFIEPTVLTGLGDDMRITQEEVFGPVQQIYKFKDIAEVIERANNTKYGLAGAVFTNDVNKIMTITNEVKAGLLWVNCYFAHSPGMAFGGYKQSGYGRDLGEYSLQQYTEVKSVITKVVAKH